MMRANAASTRGMCRARIIPGIIPARTMHASARMTAALLVGMACLAVVGAARRPTPPALTLVVCAPGYPGSTAEAQPAMDTLAAAVSAAANWKTGELGAVYFETESAGLERIALPDSALVLVPLPFWLK